jgi:hypothetical protein
VCGYLRRQTAPSLATLDILAKSLRDTLARSADMPHASATSADVNPRLPASASRTARLEGAFLHLSERSPWARKPPYPAVNPCPAPSAARRAASPDAKVT